MAYSQQTWADGSGGGTPIEAANLTHIESGLGTADANATTALGQLGKPLALTGAVAATRFVGGTASGAPVTGSFLLGDYVVDQSGGFWVCSASGSPGTWVHVQAVTIDTTGTDITVSAPSDTQSAGSTGKAADAGHRHGREAAFSIPMLSGVLASSRTTNGTLFSIGSLAVGTWLINANAVGTAGGATASFSISATGPAGITLSEGNISSQATAAAVNSTCMSLTFFAVVTSAGSVTVSTTFTSGATLVGAPYSGWTAIKIA